MSAPQWGHVAEWLRSGLQNRLHQFNSGRGLQSNPLIFQQQPHSRSVRLGSSANGLLTFRLQSASCREASTIATASACIPGITWE